MQAKLAAARASFVFRYVYVDILGLSMPGVIDDILVVASVYVLVSAANALGESWTYYFTLAVGLEVLVLALILRYAWTWPRTARPATVDHDVVRMQKA